MNLEKENVALYRANIRQLFSQLYLNDPQLQKYSTHDEDDFREEGEQEMEKETQTQPQPDIIISTVAATTITSKIDRLSTNLEIGIYNYTLKEASRKNIVRKWDNKFFLLIYKDRVRVIYMNFSSVISLKWQYYESQITPQQLSSMTHQEMNMGKWAEIIKDKLAKDTHKFELTMEASTDTFTCKKCRQNKCKYYQLQTRSADEAMTTFVQCCNSECNHRWKFS